MTENLRRFFKVFRYAILFAASQASAQNLPGALVKIDGPLVQINVIQPMIPKLIGR